jgi:hypothetical protein
MVGPGTPVTVVEEAKAYVKARVDHPGVTLEGYFEANAIGTTFIMGHQALEKPRVNAELVAEGAALGPSASGKSEKPVPAPAGTLPTPKEPAFSIQVLDAPKGRPVATLTSNVHTFVEVDKDTKKDGFRWVVVHAAPISLLPVVAGPVVSGWVHESELKDVKPRDVDEWPVKEQAMPDAGTHGPASGKKRNVEPRTILLAEPDGQVVGAVVSDGVSATPHGDSDVVLVNNGFGSTFSLYLGGILVEEKRRSGRGKGQGPGKGMGPGRGPPAGSAPSPHR